MNALKKDMTLGFSGVIRSWKNFIPFFIAAIIVQSLFISILTIGWSVEVHYKGSVSDDFNYHYILEGMDDNAHVTFRNYLVSLDPVEGQIASELKHETYALNSGFAHRYYVTLNDSNPMAKYHFEEALTAATSAASYSFTVTPSPLTVVNSYLTNNRLVIIALTLLSFAVSVFLLVAVYSVRISHYRFMYGVYMTCGAGYAKLVGTAIFEMLTVFALTFIPSVIVSMISVLAIFSQTVMTVHFGIHMILLAVILSVGVILCAVGVPMKRVSCEMPISLINKGGTAEYVISPKRSEKLFGKTFPFSYEVISIFRFSKYYMITLAVCIIFCSLFITGIYAGELNDQVADKQIGSLAISCPTGFDEEELRMVDALDTVDYLIWDESVEGIRVHSFLIMDRAQNLRSLGTVEYNEAKDATLDVDYAYFDCMMIDTLKENGLASFEGDPYEILLNDGTPRVIISRDVSNVERYGFKVGDTVSVCICIDPTFEVPTTQTTTNADVLEYCIDQSKNILSPDDEGGSVTPAFVTVDFKICAIIDYAAPSANTVFAVNGEAYEYIAQTEKRSAEIVNVEVCTAKELSIAEESDLFNRISRIVSVYREWRVERTFNALKAQLADETHILGVFIVMAIFMLIGLPLMWLFSQKVFYEKREDEIELLRCIGSSERSIFYLYLTDAGMLSLICFTVTVIFSTMVSAFIFGVATLILPLFNVEGIWKLQFHISPAAVAISAVVCMLCGFVAAMLAYLKGYRIRNNKETEYIKSRKGN